MTFYPNCERKMIFYYHQQFLRSICDWVNSEVFNFISHSQRNTKWIMVLIEYCLLQNQCDVDRQWTMLFVFLLPWKGKNKLLQKWILYRDNQIKSNHNHIYKHFILRLSYLSVIIKYTNITSKYHFIENFHQNNIVFNCELKIHSSKSSFWNHIHESTSINLMI